jgi:hypothetical protein
MRGSFPFDSLRSLRVRMTGKTSNSNSNDKSNDNGHNDGYSL